MDDFEQYLEKYCVKHECSKEEAKRYLLIKEVQKFYEDKKRSVV